MWEWVTVVAICYHGSCLPLFMRVVLLQWIGWRRWAGEGRKLLAAGGVGFKFNRVNFPGEGRLYSHAAVIMERI